MDQFLRRQRYHHRHENQKLPKCSHKKSRLPSKLRRTGILELPSLIHGRSVKREQALVEYPLKHRAAPAASIHQASILFLQHRVSRPTQSRSPPLFKKSNRKYPRNYQNADLVSLFSPPNLEMIRIHISKLSGLLPSTLRYIHPSMKPHHLHTLILTRRAQCHTFPSMVLTSNTSHSTPASNGNAPTKKSRRIRNCHHYLVHIDSKG